jgi:hypothetical protein
VIPGLPRRSGRRGRLRTLTLLDRLLPVYAEALADLRAAGAEWVQLDEPSLVQDRTPAGSGTPCLRRAAPGVVTTV